MTVARSVADVLSEHVIFECECIDRMYLNCYVPQLQRVEGIVWFWRGHREATFASSALMEPMSQTFIDGIHRFAEAHDIPWVHFAKGQRKDDVMAAHLADFDREEGVVFIGRAQEKTTVFRTEKRRNPVTGQTYPWIVSSTAMVNHFYVYAVDRDFGPFFLKFGSYFPYNAKLCLNGHEWAKRQAVKAGLAFTALDNGFAAVEDPAALQRICDRLGPAQIEALLRKWLRILPHPFTGADRAAGYRYQLSVLQAEFSLTQVLDQPRSGRVFFEPGWDVNVDGHLINVKVTADAARTAAQHFADHPDIPIVVNADAAHISAHALYFDPAHGLDPSALVGDHLVLVDQALQLHAAAAAVFDAFGVDALHGALGDAHVPVVGAVVTAARSSWREGKLLQNGQTSAARAAKNVSVDTATRGVGVIAGFKAGAASGAAIDMATGGATMGLGTVILGIGGAVAGSMAGSAAGRKIRLAPLHRAQQEATASYEIYDQAVDREHAVVQDKIDLQDARTRLALLLRAYAAKRSLDATVEAAETELAAARHIETAAVLQLASADLDDRVRRLDTTFVGSARGPRILLKHELRRARRSWAVRAAAAAVAANDDPDHAAAFWDAIAASPAGDTAMADYITGVETHRRRAYADVLRHARELDGELVAARMEARARLAGVIETSVAAARQRLEPLASKLDEANERFTRECAAAGLETEAAPA